MMEHRARHLALLLVSWALVLAAGCQAHRAAAPSGPRHTGSRADARDVPLYLRTFAIEGTSRVDGQRDTERLQDALLDYVESCTSFAAVGYNLSGKRQLEAEALELHVRVLLEQETHRTYLYDVLNVFPGFGVLPLVPWWGEVQVDIEMAVSRPEAAALATFRRVVRAPFSAVAYGWYRRGYVEQAYRRAYDAAFQGVAEDLAAQAERLRAAALALPSEAPAMPAEAPGSAEVIVLSHEGFHVVTRDEGPAIDGTWYSYLRLLGGVELSGFYGWAHVSSHAEDRSGEKIEVASGDAHQLGYRVALYTAPTTTGFFAYPVIGFLSQQISNVDTRSGLPQYSSYDRSGEEIPAVASDPQPGERVDPGTANVYDLHMKSGYGGLRVGYDVVAGSERVVFFLTLSAGVNIAEYRDITAKLVECGRDVPAADCRSKRQGWDFLRSAAAGGTIGVKWPKAHFAIRLIADYELYRKLAYGRPLEVRGPAEYVPDKDIFEHPRLSMNGASLATWNVQLATAAVF